MTSRNPNQFVHPDHQNGAGEPTSAHGQPSQQLQTANGSVAVAFVLVSLEVKEEIQNASILWLGPHLIPQVPSVSLAPTLAQAKRTASLEPKCDRKALEHESAHHHPPRPLQGTDRFADQLGSVDLGVHGCKSASPIECLCHTTLAAQATRPHTLDPWPIFAPSSPRLPCLAPSAPEKTNRKQRKTPLM